MGNLYGWGGPLPPAWHAHSVALQHRILRRMRGLGMIPVVPAFAGHVPKALLDLHPNATFDTLSWNGFNATFLLEPDDPLFHTVGVAFMREYAAEFGSDHVYSCDTFNEMTPRTNATEYLSRMGASVYAAMAAHDPLAVWLMQGWLFLSPFWQLPQVEALLTAVPTGAMIVLDLDSTNAEQFTRTKSFFGQPFIFNDLNNYGGNVGLFGRIGNINSRVFEARNMTNSSMASSRKITLCIRSVQIVARILKSVFIIYVFRRPS
jgi:alpha-N-acetylglucosaminidase